MGDGIVEPPGRGGGPFYRARQMGEAAAAVVIKLIFRDTARPVGNHTA